MSTVCYNPYDRAKAIQEERLKIAAAPKRPSALKRVWKKLRNTLLRPSAPVAQPLRSPFEITETN